MAQAIKKAAPAPVTAQVQGKTVQVTGTKNGAISTAQQQAKASKLKGSAAPAQVGKYAGSAAIRLLPQAANPHRGGYRAAAYNAMAACKTAGEYALTGYKTKYLARWVALGLIRVG